MTKKDDALKLALDYVLTHSIDPGVVFAAIKDALAQPEQEPVATVQCIRGIIIGYLDVMQPVGTKLYTFPPQRKPLTVDRVIDCAKRLVEHADFQLGGVLSADSKAKDIPSKAMSQVKARHLAALRDALAAHGIKDGS